MLEIRLCCAMCGCDKDLGMVKFTAPDSPSVTAIIERAGWIWQHNGDNFDVYCSKRCAL